MGGMDRLRKLPLLLLALLALSLCLIVPALGVSIGVNKARISYVDVLQNGYAQERVLVTTDSPETITGTYEMVGDIAPWIRVEPPVEFFNFSKDHPYQVTLIVEPPQDTRLGDYSGGVRILTGEIARTEGGKIGTSTRAAFLIRVGLGVTGTQRISCKVGGVQVKDTEIGQPYDFLASILNDGNVRIRPDFVIQVYDQYQTRLVQNATVQTPEEILPTTTYDLLAHVAQGLPVGQYWARVAAPLCQGSAYLTFDVLDRGAIADKGELLRIEAAPWASTGDIVPINAYFRNTGGRTVSAKFSGTITRQDTEKVFKVIDTEQQNVQPGETAQIATFFNPTEPGQYIVAGRVLYNGKLTFQKNAIINVRGPAMISSAGLNWMLLLLVIILILFLLILIARKRRRGARYRGR